MTRRILVVPHPQRADAVEAAGRMALYLAEHGIEVRVVCDPSQPVEVPEHERIAEATPQGAAEGCELVVVLGGDGTILWAAEISHGSGVPLLGVNLGHVGFLAEAEREELDVVAQRVLTRSYTVEERMTLEVVASLDGEVVARSWALNEVTVEKSMRQRMFILGTEIDGRPLATNGCDGIVVATPTGSTAYAFSAGGPVVWPDVEALLLVPVSAHALFSRPLVLAPSTQVAIVVQPDEDNKGVLACDGRRMAQLPPGTTVDVAVSDVRVRFARLSAMTFTDRLVAKFELSVAGWRGRTQQSFGPRAVPVTAHPGTALDAGVTHGPAPARPDYVGRETLGRRGER